MLCRHYPVWRAASLALCDRVTRPPVLVLFALPVTLFACTSVGSRRQSPEETPAEAEYLVTLQPWASEQRQFSDSVAALLHGRVNWIYNGFKGFSIFLPADSAADRLRHMRDVRSIELSTNLPFSKK